MGNKGGMFMAQMLQINTTLESLDVGDTDLVSISISIVVTVIVDTITTTAVIMISYHYMIISRIRVALLIENRP